MIPPRRKKSRFKTIMSLLLAGAMMLSVSIQASASPLPSSGTPLTAESAADFLDELFASDQAQSLYKGASISVVQDGRVLALKGYGYADAEEEREVDPARTVFRIASVSKTVTALAIMQLVEQGKIDLHEDIGAYLPGIEVDNRYDAPVTVENLLTHQSGFEVRDPDSGDLHTDFDRYVAIEDYVKAHMPPVVRESGTSYMYDNFAYLLLGLIVQNVSGEPFERYMENHVLKPLGMANSGFELTQQLRERLAKGYDAADNPIEPYTFSPTIMPHGGMLSTAEDMSRFMIAFLDGGQAPNGRILSEQSAAAMVEYRSAIHPLLPNTGYSFEAPTQLPLAGSSDKILTKVGDLPGNSSLLLLIPEQRTGVFLTYNKTGVLRDLFYARFIAKFFPEYASPAKWDAFEPYSPERLKPLEGLYADLRLRSLVFSVEVSRAGTLTVNDALLGPRILRQVDVNLFVDESTQRYTAFQVDKETGEKFMKEPSLNPLGYAMKGGAPEGFEDVDPSDAYAPFILALQSLGHYPNRPGESFQPHMPVTRAELVYHLLAISGLKGSKSTAYAFSDMEGHPLASYVQAAQELGMVTGDGGGRFQPDRSATRQEAAVMVWNIYRQLYPDELFAEIRLRGQTDEWAVPAVKMMAALGYHGPEVSKSEDGSVDFRSKEPLTRQEEAAALYRMLLQPVNRIIAELMPRQPEPEG